VQWARDSFIRPYTSFRSGHLMGLHIYNTLSRGVEPFEPANPPKVGVYGCGPTLYGPAHIGNFRTFLFYDLVHRYLEWRGFEVHFVMNFTDVDDKTIGAAGALGLPLGEYTLPFQQAMLEEADALGVWRFDSYPRATEYIEKMVELVQRLLDRGLAYATSDGSVFFDISAFPEYGRLSGRDLDEGRTSERIVADDYEKADARDFTVWKGVKPGDEAVGAAWDTPWGRGRPGWHLECSTMALAEVGETVDLHIGGEDLIFPHHEDEIAQSEGATGRPFVRQWIHAKHLKVDGRKMSKSLGNFVSVRDLLEDGVPPGSIRHQLLSAQYRTELNFTRAGLSGSMHAVDRLLDFESRLKAHPESPGSSPTDLPVLAERVLTEFTEAMDDDLNAPGGIAALFRFVNHCNAALDAASAIEVQELRAARNALASLDRVLGFLEVGRREREVDDGLRAWVEERIEARSRARNERDWSAADRIRDELADRGIVLEDGPQGTRWKPDGSSPV